MVENRGSPPYRCNVSGNDSSLKLNIHTASDSDSGWTTEVTATDTNMGTATVTGTVTVSKLVTDTYTATVKVVNTVTDIETDIEKGTNLADGMFTGIATHTDTATDRVAETDMDKNCQGLGGLRPPGAVINSLWKSAKIGLESVLIN